MYIRFWHQCKLFSSVHGLRCAYVCYSGSQSAHFVRKHLSHSKISRRYFGNSPTTKNSLPPQKGKDVALLHLFTHLVVKHSPNTLTRTPSLPPCSVTETLHCTYSPLMQPQSSHEGLGISRETSESLALQTSTGKS